MKNKKFVPYNAELDEEEQGLLDSFERGEWKSVDNLEEAKVFARKVAANTLRKDARVIE